MGLDELGGLVAGTAILKETEVGEKGQASGERESRFGVTFAVFSPLDSLRFRAVVVEMAVGV